MILKTLTVPDKNRSHLGDWDRITGNTEAIRRWSAREPRDRDCRQKNHLCFSPVVFPFYTAYDVLRQSSAACKAL
jgi:hypothetical protein